MQYPTVTILVGTFLLLSCGCQTHQLNPPFAWDWSETINGIRMSALPIADSPYIQGTRTVLIFTQNVGDDGIEVPDINPAPFVTARPNGEALYEQPQLSGNLRIQIESADKEGIHLPQYRFEQLQEMQQVSPALMPGEVRVFALILKTDETPVMMMQQVRDREVQTGMTQWPIRDHEPRQYHVYLSYRPAGFGPPTEKQRREASEPRWAGQKIDLPPFGMTVPSTNRSNQ